MGNSNIPGNVKEWPYIITSNDEIIEANQPFFELTGYSMENIIHTCKAQIFSILKVGPSIDIENINEEADYFLFNKSLEVRFVNIKAVKQQDKELYIFIEKPNSRLDDKLIFVEQTFKDNIMGAAIFSAPDLILLKANQKYLNFIAPPFNIRENSIGRSIREIMKGFTGSQGEAVLNTVLETQKTNYIKEFKFEEFARGTTYWDSTQTPVFENGKMKYIFEIAHDVTERVLNRKKIQEQMEVISSKNKKLKAILDNMSDALMVFDKDGNFTLKNKAAMKYEFSRSLKNVYDTNIPGIFFDLEGNEFQYNDLPALQVLKGEKVKEQSLCLKIPQGEKYISISGTPLFDDDGNLYKGVLCIRDITELIAREKQEIEQKEELEVIIENMSEGLAVVDKHGRYIRVNKKVKDHIQKSTNLKNPVDRIGESLDMGERYYDETGKLLSLEDFPAVKVIKGEKVENQRIVIKHGDNTFYFDFDANPIFDDNGEVRLGIIHSRDVTEQVERENLITEQKEQLQAVIENMSDSLFIINPDGSYKYYNKRAFDMFYQMENIKRLGDSAKHTEYFDERGKKLDIHEFPGSRVLNGEKIENIILMAKRPNKTVYYNYNGSPIYNEKGELISAIVCVHDMTKFLENERALKESQLKLIEGDKDNLIKSIQMKDEFLSLISHELRTPLNVINTAIQAMNYICGDELSNNAKEFISTIRRNTFRQLRLVNNLLDITRANEGRTKIHKKNLDIVFLTKAITESVYTYASQKGVRVTFVTSFQKRIIGIDDEKYERILLNLLSNAIKFTPEGKSIIVNLRSIKGDIRIQVKDSGIGIPDDKLEVIFERFGQVDSSLSRQAEGAGIGLSLVKKFVEALGGSIAVKSKVGKGTTFTVLLPSEKVTEEHDAKPMVDLMDNRLVQTTNVEFSDIYL